MGFKSVPWHSIPADFAVLYGPRTPRGGNIPGKKNPIRLPDMKCPSYEGVAEEMRLLGAEWPTRFVLGPYFAIEIAPAARAAGGGGKRSR